MNFQKKRQEKSESKEFDSFEFQGRRGNRQPRVGVAGGVAIKKTIPPSRNLEKNTNEPRIVCSHCGSNKSPSENDSHFRYLVTGIKYNDNSRDPNMIIGEYINSSCKVLSSDIKDKIISRDIDTMTKNIECVDEKFNEIYKLAKDSFNERRFKITLEKIEENHSSIISFLKESIEKKKKEIEELVSKNQKVIDESINSKTTKRGRIDITDLVVSKDSFVSIPEDDGYVVQNKTTYVAQSYKSKPPKSGSIRNKMEKSGESLNYVKNMEFSKAKAVLKDIILKKINSKDTASYLLRKLEKAEKKRMFLTNYGKLIPFKGDESRQKVFECIEDKIVGLIAKEIYRQTHPEKSTKEASMTYYGCLKKLGIHIEDGMVLTIGKIVNRSGKSFSVKAVPWRLPYLSGESIKEFKKNRLEIENIIGKESRCLLRGESRLIYKIERFLETKRNSFDKDRVFGGSGTILTNEVPEKWVILTKNTTMSGTSSSDFYIVDTISMNEIMDLVENRKADQYVAWNDRTHGFYNDENLMKDITVNEEIANKISQKNSEHNENEFDDQESFLNEQAALEIEMLENRGEDFKLFENDNVESGDIFDTAPVGDVESDEYLQPSCFLEKKGIGIQGKKAITIGKIVGKQDKQFLIKIVPWLMPRVDEDSDNVSNVVTFVKEPRDKFIRTKLAISLKDKEEKWVIVVKDGDEFKIDDTIKISELKYLGNTFRINQYFIWNKFSEWFYDSEKTQIKIDDSVSEKIEKLARRRGWYLEILKPEEDKKETVVENKFWQDPYNSDDSESESDDDVVIENESLKKWLKKKDDDDELDFDNI